MIYQAMASSSSFIIADLENESDIRKFMHSMTKPAIKQFLKEKCGIHIRNFDRTSKPTIIELIVQTWGEISEAMKKKDNQAN